MDDRTLTAALADACTRLQVPGAALGLLRGTERLVVTAGVREAGRDDPVSHTTRFPAGSITTALTAQLVLDAHERGELDIDVPCDQQSSASWPVTPRQLMAQTTGRPNLLPGADESLHAFVARVAGLPLLHRPGRFSCCGSGWPVLDLLLRDTAGATFEELARDRVLGGAGRFGRPADGARGHAVAAMGEMSSVPWVDGEAASAAGSRWWATADELLDFAAMHLHGDQRHPLARLERQREAEATVPGATTGDASGLGWALWDRPGHRAFGSGGYTAGYRAHLRCFPDHDAALVLLTNAAGSLFGPPGGSAVLDDLLPILLETLGVPEAPAPDGTDAPRPVSDLAGTYGPVTVYPAEDGLTMAAYAFGETRPLSLVRAWGDTFVPAADLRGAMPVAFDRDEHDDLMYVGPFALPVAPRPDR